MPDLLPCPWCGHQPTLSLHAKKFGEVQDSHAVVQCCVVMNAYVEPIEAAKRHAIKAWNTRAKQDEARDE